MSQDPAVLMRLAGLALATWLLLVWAAGVAYVVVSYAVAARRLPPRSGRRAAYWMLQESVLVMWTQPLMPLFQLFGQRMGSGGGDVPVVLVHGYFQNRVDFLYLAHRLRRAGCGPLYACNFFWPQSLDTSSRHVKAFVESVAERTGADRVDVLTHSAGGLLALDLVAERPDLVRKLAVVAIPARGVAWRGPVIGWSGSQLRAGSPYQEKRSCFVVKTPTLSVYSAHDNVVYPVTTSMLEGDDVTNIAVDGPGHLSVLFMREIADAVVGFFGDGTGGERKPS